MRSNFESTKIPALLICRFQSVLLFQIGIELFLVQIIGSGNISGTFGDVVIDQSGVQLDEPQCESIEVAEQRQSTTSLSVVLTISRDPDCASGAGDDGGSAVPIWAIVVAAVCCACCCICVVVVVVVTVPGGLFFVRVARHDETTVDPLWRRRRISVVNLSFSSNNARQPQDSAF